MSEGGVMSDGYDRFDNDTNSGSSFVMGLLTGTVLGAGLGMLFAPKAGSELRNQISEQAGSIANQASEGYRRASETAGEWAEKGRDMYNKAYDKARDAVSKGADEAERYVREATSPSGPATARAGSPSPYSAESMRGSTSEQIRGSQSTDKPAGPTGRS
jgi:gas vesicle protein